ncbi:MAG: glycosyltransferase [Calditrichae bacterium]|nr:glycosyltransferase [Calditrichia bacterium]NIV71918.1 glycosyltransferase [Calditrichia bacterium]
MNFQKDSQTKAFQKRQCGIIIPVYNSAQFLEELLHRIARVQANLSDWTFQVVIVDDGSRPAVPQFSHFDNLDMTQLRHDDNLGKGAALKSGFIHFLKQEGISAVLSLDADLQHPPEYIPQFLEKFERGREDILIGSRRRHLKVMPFHRIISNTLTSFIISLLIGQKVLDSQCGFRLYSRRALQSVHAEETRFHLESEFLIRSGWQNFSIGHVQIPTIYNDAPSAIKNIPDTVNFIGLIFRLLKERISGNVRPA